jgi:23S rRNA-/tRNA-specific pseudouridylate synthase
VINKPYGVPVHQCGLFKNNSLLNILTEDFDMKELLRIFFFFNEVVHRLDRVE